MIIINRWWYSFQYVNQINKIYFQTNSNIIIKHNKVNISSIIITNKCLLKFAKYIHEHMKKYLLTNFKIKFNKKVHLNNSIKTNSNNTKINNKTKV